MVDSTNVSKRNPDRFLAPLMALSAVPMVMHFLALAFEVVSEDVWSKEWACLGATVFFIVAGVMTGPRMEATRNGWRRVLQVSIGALMIILVFPVMMQVVSRVDIIPRYIWTEEIARFCFIWIIMLGAMLGVREDTHFDVDLLPTPKTIQGRGWSKLVVHGAMMIIAVTFIFYGYDFAKSAAYQTSEIAELPMILIYVSWPIAGVTWTMFLAAKLREDVLRIRGVEPRPEGDAEALEVKVKLEEVM